VKPEIVTTTWSGYKQYLERDVALELHLQMIKVDEPDNASACLLLRDLMARNASHHGVHIQEVTVQAAGSLSRHYPGPAVAGQGRRRVGHGSVFWVTQENLLCDTNTGNIGWSMDKKITTKKRRCNYERGIRRPIRSV
jgi:hypothetical protein